MPDTEQRLYTVAGYSFDQLCKMRGLGQQNGLWASLAESEDQHLC